MKHTKRVLAAMCALLLAVAFLAGCGPQGGASSTGAPADSGGTSAGSAPGADEPREVIEVSVAHWQLTEPSGNYAAEKVYNKILEDFGIDIKIVPVTWADSDEKIRMLASSDDLPDIFDHGAWDLKSDFKTYVDQGLIREIPQALYDKYPNVKSVMDEYNYEAMPDGLMYHMPRNDRAYEKTNGNPIGFMYRKDFAEALGYTDADFADMSIEDFTEFIYALAKDDPNGNGVNDTYGLSSATSAGLGYMSELVYPMFGWRPWVYEDGKWVYGFVGESAKEATQWLHTLYKDGVLDPEFAITLDSQLREKLSIGQVGCVPDTLNTSNAALFRTTYWEELNPDLPIDDYLGAIPLPTREDGTRNSKPKTYWSATCVSSNVDDEKLDRILEMYDWLYSVDGYIFTTWGEEGVDYEVVDGTVTSLILNDAGTPEKFSSGSPFGFVSVMASWHLDGIPDVAEGSATEWDLEMDTILKETYWVYNYPGDFSKYLFTDALDEFDINAYVESTLVTLIMQSTDFESDWQAFVDDLYANYNLQAVVDDVNAAAVEKGIEWEPYK